MNSVSGRKELAANVLSRPIGPHPTNELSGGIIAGLSRTLASL